MKKTIILALAIAATLNLSAQELKPCDRPCEKQKKGTEFVCKKKAADWMCKKQAQRKAYVVSKMELKEAEKAAFEAMYDTYRKEISASRKTLKNAERQMNDSCSNEQYEKCLETINNEKNSQAKINSDFYQAMKKMLSARQIYLFYKADKEFNKLMMKEMHQPKPKPKK